MAKSSHNKKAAGSGNRQLYKIYFKAYFEIADY